MEEKDKQGGKPLPLTWRDYIALSIAALETVLAPLIIVVVIIFVVALIVTGHL